MTESRITIADRPLYQRLCPQCSTRPSQRRVGAGEAATRQHADPRSGAGAPVEADGGGGEVSVRGGDRRGRRLNLSFATRLLRLTPPALQSSRRSSRACRRRGMVPEASIELRVNDAPGLRGATHLVDWLGPGHCFGLGYVARLEPLLRNSGSATGTLGCRLGQCVD
jgi:hypothetical protein